MKRFLERSRLALKESNDMGRLLTLEDDERSVVVYAEDTFSYIQLKGYLQALWADQGISYQYVTSDPEDPLLQVPPAGAKTWFVRDQLPRLMASLECRVFLTTMPDLGKFHVPRPKSGKTVYAFHSLNSTHTAYRAGAFDNYDQFLCTGPHHVEELRRLRTDSAPELSEVGYYKLDLIRDEHREFIEKAPVEGDVVLLAPSWGPDNLLEAHGVEIIQSLLSSRLTVIVRPHPQFFHSLYPLGAEVIGSLRERFGSADNVEFELNINSQDSFHRSSLMISDWSGAAFEYAFGTLRRVLFVDTPQKIFNDDWESIGLPSFENSMRGEVGEVVPQSEVGTIGERAWGIIETSGGASSDIQALLGRVVFNSGASAGAGAAAIAESM